MIPARELVGAGTAEGVWAGGPLERLDELVVGRPRRAVVVAPHPDDEVLAAGGLMQRLANAGIPLTLVGVTDGEASHPRSPTVTPITLTDTRADERCQALRLLGLRHVTVLRLGLPDGGVAREGGELEGCLAGLLGPDVLCISPWSGDGHPDHDAAGQAAAAASAATGAPFLDYLVWTWHWATPEAEDVPWSRGRRLALTRVEQTRKRWAIRAFASQVAALSARAGDEAILAPEMLRHFDRPFEVFLT